MSGRILKHVLPTDAPEFTVALPRGQWTFLHLGVQRNQPCMWTSEFEPIVDVPPHNYSFQWVMTGRNAPLRDWHYWGTVLLDEGESLVLHLYQRIV